MPRRLSILAALVTVLLAGCSTPAEKIDAAPSSAVPSTVPSPTEVPPMDAVRAALNHLTSETYSFAATGNGPGHKYVASGVHDPRAREHSWKYLLEGEKARSRKVIVIGGDGYLKRGSANRWEHVDLTRLKPVDDNRYADPADPTGLTRFTAALHSARRLGPTRYEGVVQLQATPGALSYLPLGAPIFLVRQGGQWVTYTLETDAEGNPTSIKTVQDAGPDGSLTTVTKFANLGRPVRITKP
ncbi:hypothetical protein [Paractinoplanes lichenicola]|uniref:Lipoprotein n=1 Tax=Paractinoplanes lichenicola TaxID=2802976 RepID=A0ABS1W4H6_9ACTN|nr:hypothetical protein [Actinoplanes lichenicola]MBL7261631.1 hypothetical protein [Actinoplanes lichenicola]